MWPFKSKPKNEVPVERVPSISIEAMEYEAQLRDELQTRIGERAFALSDEVGVNEVLEAFVTVCEEMADELRVEKIVVVSGGFDPVHVGHLRMMQEAKKLGNYLIVVVNNDNWLRAKKGYNFMTEQDRKELIEGFECVDEVWLTSHQPNCTDMSVCNELRFIQPDVFANGGDRKSDNIPEYEVCNELGIKMEFNVGGEKLRSSSELVANAKSHGE